MRIPKKKSTITKQKFIEWAVNKGWRPDTHGHLRKERDGREYRFKLSSTSVRYEIKVHHGKNTYTGRAENEWVRLRSGYYKDLTINEKGQLAGMA